MTPLEDALEAVVSAAMRPMVAELRELRSKLEALQCADAADELLTVDEAADLLGTSHDALRKRISRGSLTVVRSGRSIRVRKRDLLHEDPAAPAR